MVHWLAHVLGWNYGHLETFSVGGRTFVCFVCRCGRRSDQHDITALIDYDWDRI